MITRILDASIRFRWGVVIATLIIAAYGVTQLLKLPIDAVPDITNKQVQINTVSPNLGPLDMERPEVWRDRVDLHLLVGDVGNGIDRQLQKLCHAVGRDNQRGDHDRPTKADCRVKNASDHLNAPPRPCRAPP